MYFNHKLPKDVIGSIVFFPDLENMENRSKTFEEVTEHIHIGDLREELPYNTEIGHVTGLSLNNLKEILLKVEVAQEFEKGTKYELDKRSYIKYIHVSNVVFL
jgi:hypothetical protein